MDPSTTTPDEEFAVCAASDVAVGTMREVSAGDLRVLLFHVDGHGFHATSTKCTHYSAPLVKGTFCGDRVYCPWHAACFSVTSGDIEEAPALDGLFRYPCSERDGTVYVRVPVGGPKQWKRTLPMCAPSSDDRRTFVVVGGGPAGLICAETLRQEGFGGKIIMFNREPHLPYDRVKCSKILVDDASRILLRQPAFYESHGIETRMGEAVTAVDVAGRTVSTASGESITFDGLLVAVGGAARTLPDSVVNSKTANMFVVRTADDSIRMSEFLDAAKADGRKLKVVVIGSGFIGLETIALIGKNESIESVNVITNEEQPLSRVFGAQLGRLIRTIHEDRGVQFHLERQVQSVGVNADGLVSSVTVDNGTVLECDLLVVGIGIALATSFLRDSGLELDARDGSILCDSFMHAKNCPAPVYVAGDCARFQHHKTGRHLRIEHWNVAEQQARIAARNFMRENPTPYSSVPFFWTQQYGISFRFCGHIDEPGYKILFDEASNQKSFLAYFVAGERVIAVFSMARDPAVTDAMDELHRTGEIRLPDNCKLSLE